MWGDVYVAMEAINPSRNVFRAWRLDLGHDLLGDLVIAISYGRKGTRGRTIIQALPEDARARRIVKSMLARRTSAPRRIGVAYRTVASAGLDTWLADLQP